MEPEIQSVAHPPEMDDGLDYVVKHGDRRYGFQTPERGQIVLVSVTRRATEADGDDAADNDRRTFVPDETFNGTLPEPIRETVLTYFREEFGDEMDIDVSLRRDS